MAGLFYRNRISKCFSNLSLYIGARQRNFPFFEILEFEVHANPAVGLLIHIGQELRRLEQGHEILRQKLGLVGPEDVVGSADDLVVVVELIQADGTYVHAVGVVAELVRLHAEVGLLDFCAGFGLVQKYAVGVGNAEYPEEDLGECAGLDAVGVQSEIFAQAHARVTRAALYDLTKRLKLVVLGQFFDRVGHEVLPGDVELQGVLHVEHGKSAVSPGRRAVFECGEAVVESFAVLALRAFENSFPLFKLALGQITPGVGKVERIRVRHLNAFRDFVASLDAPDFIMLRQTFGLFGLVELTIANLLLQFGGQGILVLGRSFGELRRGVGLDAKFDAGVKIENPRGGNRE